MNEIVKQGFISKLENLKLEFALQSLRFPLFIPIEDETVIYKLQNNLSVPTSETVSYLPSIKDKFTSRFGSMYLHYL